MGELLYLYLEENDLLDEIANALVVERNTILMNKKKSSKCAYFEGSKYFNNYDFREYVDCYEYTYAINTTFILNGENIFSHIVTKRGISTEIERPHGVYGNENANCLYHNASGRESAIYQKIVDEDCEYKLKHLSYSGNAKEKVFKLPMTLRSLLENEPDFSALLCNMYNIDLNNYSNELTRRKLIFEKVMMIDKQIIQLEKLKNDYLDQLHYGKSKK